MLGNKESNYILISLMHNIILSILLKYMNVTNTNTFELYILLTTNNAFAGL